MDSLVLFQNRDLGRSPWKNVKYRSYFLARVATTFAMHSEQKDFKLSLDVRTMFWQSKALDSKFIHHEKISRLTF